MAAVIEFRPTRPATPGLRLLPSGPTGPGARSLRRRVVALVALLVALVLSVQLLGGVTQRSTPRDPVGAATHVVAPGETLWSIAGAVAGGGDRHQVLADLVRANGGSVDVRVGQVLELPPSRAVG